jgi:hypothetical protein
MTDTEGTQLQDYVSEESDVEMPSVATAMTHREAVDAVGDIRKTDVALLREQMLAFHEQQAKQMETLLAALGSLAPRQARVEDGLPGSFSPPPQDDPTDYQIDRRERRRPRVERSLDRDPSSDRDRDNYSMYLSTHLSAVPPGIGTGDELGLVHGTKERTGSRKRPRLASLEELAEDSGPQREALGEVAADSLGDGSELESNSLDGAGPGNSELEELGTGEGAQGNFSGVECDEVEVAPSITFTDLDSGYPPTTPGHGDRGSFILSTNKIPILKLTGDENYIREMKPWIDAVAEQAQGSNQDWARVAKANSVKNSKVWNVVDSIVEERGERYTTEQTTRVGVSSRRRYETLTRLRPTTVSFAKFGCRSSTTSSLETLSRLSWALS